MKVGNVEVASGLDRILEVPMGVERRLRVLRGVEGREGREGR